MSKNTESTVSTEVEAATPQQETALTTFQEDGQHVVVAASVADQLLAGANGNFLTSIKDDGTPATRARIFNAINDNTDTIKNMINRTLEVTDIMAYPVSLVNVHGEMEDAVRVVVITKDGNSYGSVAKGVFTSMQQLIAICGMPPWESVKLTPVTKKTRNGFETLVFRMEA